MIRSGVPPTNRSIRRSEENAIAVRGEPGPLHAVIVAQREQRAERLCIPNPHHPVLGIRKEAGSIGTEAHDLTGIFLGDGRQEPARTGVPDSDFVVGMEAADDAPAIGAEGRNAIPLVAQCRLHFQNRVELP